MAGWLIGKIGRRCSLVVAVVPGMLGWLTIALAPDPTLLIVGRFLDGITAGMVSLAVITYATEIPDTRHRGSFGTIVCLMFLFGAGVCVCLGISLTWYQVAFVNVGVLLVYMIAIVPCLPESPTFLAVTNQTKEARDVLLRLRGADADVDGEIQLLKNLNQINGGSSRWGALLNCENMKRILLMSVLFFIQNFSGTSAVRVNATRILETSGVELDKDTSTILLFTVPIFGAFVLTLLVDRLGRRVCLVASLIPMMLAYCVLGFYIKFSHHSINFATLDPLDINLTNYTQDTQLTNSLDNKWSMVPLACLVVSIFAMNIGIESLPYHLASELFPTTIRSQAMCVCTVIGSVTSSAALQLYSPMQNLLGPAGLYWTYGAVSALGVPFTLLFVPETARQAVG
ncbi:facilitated trehalose transporter Tret1-2 homolog [Homarus americanus]|nr:facilitated trehalose transporter Tret1-2 homolog [Homarus americanus]